MGNSQKKMCVIENKNKDIYFFSDGFSFNNNNNNKKNEKYFQQICHEMSNQYDFAMAELRDIS